MVNFTNTNISTNAGTNGGVSGWGVIITFVVLAAAVIVAYMLWPSPKSSCPTVLRRTADGKFHLEGTSQVFDTMNDFQQFWFSSGMNASCPLPLLTGVGPEDQDLTRRWNEWPNEQTYAKTPIYKVDDYEFGRVFGFMRDGRLDIPRENYNLILNQRTYDWSELPLSSDQRREKRVELTEGFSADGELRAEMLTQDSRTAATADMITREAAARYGEKRDDDDGDCKASKEEKEVARMVAAAYENDPSFEPVVKKVGPNRWEVVELKSRRREGDVAEPIVEERVVNTAQDKVDIQFAFERNADIQAAIDPFYYKLGAGPQPTSERQQRDPYYGPVPGMERMMGPTFDHADWYYPGGAVPGTYKG
jgi:hypothetical protein